ncbi:phosphatase PAP2 family protein [Burkholderia seminalis]|uniref:phosphatase PAP2 family protein n=1 Tax=Burkholderia seminalis TaxID=488731 RepID=UPI00163AC7F9|nr:phosphatase PAP2 family protein [Burkholderia seminalis]
MKNRISVIFAGAWVIIAVVVLIDLLWARGAGIKIGHGWPLSALPEIGGIFASAVVLSACAAVDRYRPLTHAMRCKELAAAIFCLLTFMVWAQAVSVASYLGISLNVPSIADSLVRFDKAIGFDWLDAYRWVETHRSLRIVLKYAYWSAFAQLILIPIFLAVARRADDIAELLTIMFVSSALLLLISIPFPAESAFLYYGITDVGTASTVSDYALLRNGTLIAIDPYEAQGLVSMPSFHTMLAIFFTYSVRHVRFVFPTLAALNVVMIASTVTVGGHYVADVLAGILCGVAVIFAVRLGLRRWFAKLGDGARPSATSDAGESSAPAQ